MGKPTFIWENHDILQIKLFFAIICENCAKGTLRMQSTYYLAPKYAVFVRKYFVITNILNYMPKFFTMNFIDLTGNFVER